MFTKCKNSQISSNVSSYNVSKSSCGNCPFFVCVCVGTWSQSRFLDNAHKHKGAQYNINFSLSQDFMLYSIIHAHKETAKHICLFNNFISFLLKIKKHSQFLSHFVTQWGCTLPMEFSVICYFPCLSIQSFKEYFCHHQCHHSPQHQE
jgi:hypothetical protein